MSDSLNDRDEKPVYLEAMRITRVLGAELMALSRKVWALETAARNVRVARTGSEKAKATLNLRCLMIQLKLI